MLIRNSIKQMVRTPVKTILFLLLMALAAILSTLGLNLWQISASNMKAFEAVFTTIGTVEQKKAALHKEEVWDSIDNILSYHYIPEYNAPIPISVLDFDGADYIYPPEKRPFYGAYLPGYQLLPPNTNWGMGVIIIEFTVDEDCIPDHEIEINVKKQLYARYLINTPTVWFCDRYNQNPDKLFAGKTYIMAMAQTYDLTKDTLYRSVYTPVEGTESYQYTKDGKLMPDETRGILYEEVTEGFYDSEHGRRWLNCAKSMEQPYETVPVTPTNSTKLLLPFYNGTAYIESGEDISVEEYEKGEPVCLISNRFARLNNLKIGDKITLPLYYANYRHSAGMAFGGDVWIGFSMLNAKGDIYPIFYEAQYTIAGVYLSVSSGNLNGYTMADNEIIVPANSIKASDENNIVAFGPMMGYTTSFQIPNGTIEKYKKEFDKLGMDELEITFYDKGYSELKAGLDNIKSTAGILLAAGVVATVLILAFFCNLFITKQRKRTAIERSLGMSKTMCIRSMISGVLFIVLIGSIIGCLLGFLLTNTTAGVFGGKTYYSTEYTSGSVDKSTGDEMNLDYAHPLAALSLVTGAMIIVLSLVISFLVVGTNLRYEPLELLSEKTEG